VLNKDLEEREKQVAKVITQLQMMTEKYEEANNQRRHLRSQLDDTVTKLDELTKVAENYAKDLRNTQKQLDESERKKEEVKARAQETVRQYDMFWFIGT